MINVTVIKLAPNEGKLLFQKIDTEIEKRAQALRDAGAKTTEAFYIDSKGTMRSIVNG
jgi:hypothetical protein